MRHQLVNSYLTNKELTWILQNKILYLKTTRSLYYQIERWNILIKYELRRFYFSENNNVKIEVLCIFFKFGLIIKSIFHTYIFNVILFLYVNINFHLLYIVAFYILCPIPLFIAFMIGFKVRVLHFSWGFYLFIFANISYLSNGGYYFLF